MNNNNNNNRNDNIRTNIHHPEIDMFYDGEEDNITKEIESMKEAVRKSRRVRRRDEADADPRQDIDY